jgi:prepilin-type N-terminal cleavage/methylation domain-containing protein
VNRSRGFTIVELVVVVFIIGALAAAVLVSYNGVSQKAIKASLQNDLSVASNTLKLYKADNDRYPTLDSNYCPTGQPGSRYCLKPSSGNEFIYSSDSPYSTFSLTATNSAAGISYVITDSTAPALVSITNITAIAAITGTPKYNVQLTAGALTPSDATASYQWKIANTSNGTYSNITGATSSTYTPVVSDIGKYLKVSATGMGSFGGTVLSSTSSVVATNSVPVAVNGSAFTIMPGATNVMWGPDWWGEGDDTADITQSSFNLTPYNTGTISDASLTWTIGSLAGEGDASGYNVFLKRNDGTLITTWNATAHPSSSNAAGVTTFANSNKGSTITFLWDSNPGSGYENIWDIETDMTNPVLHFTWTP